MYTAAIPADPRLRIESAEYEARYVPRVPRGPDYAGRIGAYLGAVLPHYAENFLDWWRDRLRPEIERNFAYLDAVLDTRSRRSWSSPCCSRTRSTSTTGTGRSTGC